MISILIPTYNFDCTPLVHSLYLQAEKMKDNLGEPFDFEILVADDATPDPTRLAGYKQISEWAGCRFIALEKNLGRAKIRNFLASQAKFDYLIFIDCDAEVCTDDFLYKYWLSRDKGDVVCGSLRNPATCPVDGELRYRYEKSAERQRTVDFRCMHPYTYFTTFNVMFHREVLEHLQFDERCIEYGYEDALMGLMLEQKGYSVSHIENPLIHTGIDSSTEYLRKIETSLGVLLRLGEPLHSSSPLVRMKRRLKSFWLLPAVYGTYLCFKGMIRKNLMSKRPSILLLNFYKLGYYIGLDRASHRSHL